MNWVILFSDYNNIRENKELNNKIIVFYIGIIKYLPKIHCKNGNFMIQGVLLYPLNDLLLLLRGV